MTTTTLATFKSDGSPAALRVEHGDGFVVCEIDGNGWDGCSTVWRHFQQRRRD